MSCVLNEDELALAVSISVWIDNVGVTAVRDLLIAKLMCITIGLVLEHFGRSEE